MISLFQDSQPGLIMPNHLLGWLGWLVMAALLVWGTWRWRENLEILRAMVDCAFLLIGCAAFIMFLGVAARRRRLPGTPGTAPRRNVSWPLFLGLAAGLLGTIPSVVLGCSAVYYWRIFETHSPFTPLEIGALALLFSAAVRQNFRTRFYYFLHPWQRRWRLPLPTCRC